MKNTVFKSKKFKYGSTALALTLLFIVFMIAVNVLIGIFASKKGGLYLDLTSETIYDIGDTTRDVLSKLDNDGSPIKVEIIFCMEKDKMTDSDEMSYINRLAEKYAAASKNISLIYKDIIKEPLYFNQFKKTESDTVSSSSVIINCPQTQKYTVYSYRNFLKYYSSDTSRIFAYNGENRFTSSIMQLALGGMQKAVFITGHGEEKRSDLENLLRDAGYEVSECNLKETSAEDLAQNDLVIICDPRYDFTGVTEEQEGRVNEIAMLNTYLTKSFGNVLAFVGPETPNLPEFSAFLSDDWGLGYAPGSILFESGSYALDTYGLHFIASNRLDASGITSGLSDTVFGNATALGILFDGSKNGKSASPIYTTSSDALCLSGETTLKAPNTAVMVLSAYETIVDNNTETSHILLCGSVDYLNYIDMQQYANGDVLRRALGKMGNTASLDGIGYKVAEDTSLTVTQDVFRKYIILLATVIPVIIAGIGVYVYLRRKKA